VTLDNGGATVRPRRGRRPGASETRQAILDAARARFAKDGYALTTIRGIAADAGVDASLVMQFFGSKDELFATVMSISPHAVSRITAAFDGSLDSLGERLTRAYLEVWEGEPEDSESLLAVLRRAVASEQAAAQLRDLVQVRLTASIGPRLADDPDMLARLAVASSMLIGVIVGRRIIAIPSLASEEAEALIARLAPAVQVILTPARLQPPAR
jgi:AcrR family transcriptional regulator